MVKKIKVLSVGSMGKRSRISPFRFEQGESLKKKGIDLEYFNIDKHGILGYLSCLFSLRKKIKTNQYDLIHAHYGLSGMLSVLQRKMPVVISFHGSDVWRPVIKKMSLIASHLSSWNLFHSKALQNQAKGFRKNRSAIIPVGINLEKFFPMEKGKTRELMNLNTSDTYILFSSSFKNRIKNYPLAKKAVENIPESELIELDGYSQEEVNYLMNACDVLLVTSFKESGPLVVKEAMACNMPIVTTKVGDVVEVIRDTVGCSFVAYDPVDVSDKIRQALDFGKRTYGREKIMRYDIDLIAGRVIDIYDKVLNLRE
jgi:glycosyltransferase involved in cell wall biosynthesis